MSSKENINPDKLSNQISSLSTVDSNEFEQNADPSLADEVANTAPLTTIHRLPVELWIKIVELVLVEEYGDEQYIELSRLIRLSHICQFTWNARLNKYFYAKIDMVSGFVKDKQADVLSAYMHCITNRTRFIKFGDSGPNYEASTTLIDNILATFGDKASRVHFTGDYQRSSTLSSTTVDALAKPGRRLTHLHVYNYRIPYSTIVRNLLDTSFVDEIVTLELRNCRYIDDGDIQISTNDFRKCKNLTNLSIRDCPGSQTSMSIDLDDIILHLPKLQYFEGHLRRSINVNFGGRAPKGHSTALQMLKLWTVGGVTWTVPPHEFLRLCPDLESVRIWAAPLVTTLNVTAVFHGCTHLKSFFMNHFDLTVTPLTTWPAVLEHISATYTNCVELLYALGNMAKRLRDDGRPVLVSYLNLTGSSSTADSLRMCLTHMPMLTHLDLQGHDSISQEYQRVYYGRDEIDNLLGMLDNIYVDEDVDVDEEDL